MSLNNNNNNRLLNKKINEVKEVIQNRPDNDIKKVLEYYDYNVGKTIETFITSSQNDIKKILSINSNNTSGTLSPKQQQQQQQQKKNLIKSSSASSSSSIINKNNLNNKLNKLKFNINDLVDSVISKHITTSTQSEQLLTPTPTTDVIKTSLNNTNNETRPNTLNISPSSSSSSSNTTTTTTNNLNGNSNKILEKSQKDLQRQIITLNKLKTNFDEEIENSLKLSDDVFNNLRLLLDQRQNNLRNKLNNIKLNGHELLSQRQKHANELKLLVDNSQNMNDTQIQDLKNEIKQFVSERKLDEDLGLTKRLTFDSEKIKEQIDNLGEIIEVKNNYSIQKSPSSENNTPAITPTPLTLSNSIAINLFNDKKDDIINNYSNGTQTLTNGYHNNDNNEFKQMTKKPQRRNNKNIRNTNNNQQQQQPNNNKSNKQNGKLSVSTSSSSSVYLNGSNLLNTDNRIKQMV